MSRKKMTKSFEIDIHGLQEYEARAELNDVLAHIPNDVKILKIVHGYHGGQVLKNMVRNEYFNYRIDYIQPKFNNDGETWYYLKPDDDND